MAAETLVQTCRVADFDPVTGVCAAPFYSAPQPAFPELSVADATEIAFSFLLALASVMAVKIVGKKTQ